MANSLDRFGNTSFKARGIPSAGGGLQYAQDKTKGNPARGRLSGIALEKGHPSDERSARMQAQADAAATSTAERQALSQNEAAMRDDQAARVADTAQRARGEHPEQLAQQKMAREERGAREQESAMYKMRQMAELGHLIADAPLGKDGLRQLPEAALGKVAAMTGLSNLAIAAEGKDKPKLAVKLLGDPSNPDASQMQFFIGNKDKFQPLTMGDGAPVAPRLGTVNQMLSLIDRLDFDKARATAPDSTKGVTDLEKEAMDNQSANARAILETAQKNYNTVMTNDPDNKALVEAATKELTAATRGVGGAGTTYSTRGSQDAKFRPIQLAPDFDMAGSPYRAPGRQDISAAGRPGAAPPAPTMPSQAPNFSVTPPGGVPGGPAGINAYPTPVIPGGEANPLMPDAPVIQGIAPPPDQAIPTAPGAYGPGYSGTPLPYPWGATR